MSTTNPIPAPDETRYIISGKSRTLGCPVGKRFIDDSFNNRSNYNKLCIARASLYNAFSFWGHLAMTMPLVEDTTGYVRTMATDGRNIYWCSEFVEKYSPGELMFVIAHEVYHVLSLHVGRVSRRGNRNALLWNKAADFFINDELIQMNCGIPPKGFPLCHDVKYRGWTSEAIYDDLLKNGDGESRSFDDHFEIDPDWKGSVTDDEDLRDIWIDRVFRAEAARSYEESIGGSNSNRLTNSIKKMIEELHAPKHDWRSMLRMYIRSVIRKGYSYRKPNKNLFQAGITAPGFRSNSSEYDLFIAIDCSASVTVEMLSKLISEVLGLTKQLPSFRIGIGTFDTIFYDESFTILTKTSKNSTVKIESFLNNIQGGGGTLFESVWEWLKERKIKPKAMLVFTDGYPNEGWGDPSYCPTLFLITPLGEEFSHLPIPKAPFGRTVYYDG